MRNRRLWLRSMLGIGILVAIFIADRAMPPDVSRLTPSRVVEDRHGAMLRAFQTSDGQWRFAADPDAVSDTYLRLLVATEDRHFWSHPGVDPIAMLRAIGQAITHGHVVSGGSTLTMQLARLLEPRPRTLRSKLIEMGRALQIERRMSKAEILRAYVELTPMGGNLEGVRAGSLAWFGKEPKLLFDAEAALLVALPQAPRKLRPDAHPAIARQARDKILARAVREGVIATAALDSARATPVPMKRLPLPMLAPHLAERLVAADPSTTAPIHTALDAKLQGDLERTLRQTQDSLPRPVNLAALVADWHTGEILARAGSASYRDAARHGMVDMTLALRSPGSALKPFIYGMAFDGLLAHPASLVRDAPTRFDDYAPHNFDGGFNGDVTVRHALQASLNLPAVIVLQRLGPIVFAARFRQAGLPLTFADDAVVPSLPMALGGVGITLERLVTAYAALADGGSVKPLIERYDLSRGPSEGRLMERSSADAVVDILAGLPPPKGVATRSGALAYKTGTSYRFRDGWAVGFDGSRVIGVWMGRADGGSCSGCVGMASAGVLFRLFDLLAPDPLPARTLSPAMAGAPPPTLARLTQTESGVGSSAPHIDFPLAGAHLLVDDASSAVKLQVEGGQRPYRWFVDGVPVASRPFASQAEWRPAEDGFSTVMVVDGAGRSAEAKVRVVRRGP